MSARRDLDPVMLADLDVARDLAMHGIPVFLARPDPAGIGHGRTGYWLPSEWEQTRPDPAVVDRWRPGMAIAAVMGHGLDLLDVDPRSGGDQSAADIIAGGAWPRSYGRASTPSGGSHDFIASLGIRSSDNVKPGLDVKAGSGGVGHGFAFLAPTIRRSKVTGEPTPYRWLTALDLDALADTDGDDTGSQLAELAQHAHNGGSTSPTGWTDPDLDALVENGVPDGANQDSTLRDAVWKLRSQQLGRSATRHVWSGIVAKTKLSRPGEPWTDVDFARHWDGADRKIRKTEPTVLGPGATRNGDGHAAPPPQADQPGQTMHAVGAEDFAALDEDGAAALLGDTDQALIAEGSDVLIYGDGGAGKTTLAFDLAIHWATAAAWLGITIPGPVSTLLIENEGPRPLLRRKLRRKLSGTSTPLSGRVRIIDDPWATFASEGHRRQLAEIISTDEIDVIIVGPLVVAGMEAAGTLGEVREFLRHLTDVRRRAGRRVCFVLIHHQNRAGWPSPRTVDTL